MIAKALQVTLNQQGGRSVSVLLGDGVRPELDGRESSPIIWYLNQNLLLSLSLQQDL